MAEVKAARMNAKVAYNLEMGQHHLVSDVGPESGGQGLGPEPHAILNASLAACTALTLQMYANHKGWPLTSAEVSVEGEKIDGIYVFKCRIHLNGALSAEQKGRLEQMARQCPVHKTLTGPLKIEIAAI